VTFRLGDSIPEAKLKQWEAEMAVWLRAHPQPHSGSDRREFHERFTVGFHRWLDAGYGACWLRRSDVSSIVENALRFFDRQRYIVGHYVAMPNHVHALVRPIMEFTLSDVLHSWKSFTANQINRLVKRRGPLWQDESFDHLVRDEAQMERFARYIMQNPAKARLQPGEFRLGYGAGAVGQASSLSRLPTASGETSQSSLPTAPHRPPGQAGSLSYLGAASNHTKTS
jgi:REP element-mobilizing transposase RayT